MERFPSPLHAARTEREREREIVHLSLFVCLCVMKKRDSVSCYKKELGKGE